MFAEHTTGNVGAFDSSDRSAADIIERIPEAQIDQTGADDEADTGNLWQSVTLDDVHAARERVMSHLHRTPLLRNRTLGEMSNTTLVLKAEIFQRTGSFKARGALNALMQLTDEQKERGVITLSAGNHGQGLAFAASMVGTRAVVFMPETAVPTKVDAIRGYGAEPHFTPTMEGIFPLMEAYQREHGLTFVAPYSDPHIIAGQGIVGLEILEDEPEVDTVIVPIGGGGLISGIALAIKSQRPDVRIIGVEPVGSNIVKKSLDSGKLEQAHDIHTIADGLAAPFAGELTQAIISHYVDDVVLVTDEDIVEALKLILTRAKVLVEPAGAAATAALLTGKAGVKPGSRVVTLLSGGNIDATKLKSLL
jgi:threonine dehydratase